VSTQGLKNDEQKLQKNWAKHSKMKGALQAQNYKQDLLNILLDSII
jgi:hypothetical protein